MTRYTHVHVGQHLLAIDADGNVGYAGDGKGSWSHRLGRLRKTRRWVAERDDNMGGLIPHGSYHTRGDALMSLLVVHGHTPCECGAGNVGWGNHERECPVHVQGRRVHAEIASAA